MVNVSLFLVQTLFTGYSIILLIRILLPSFHGAYHNPLAQFILKMTGPLILPIRRFIRYHQKIDVAAILLLFIIELIYVYLYAWLQSYYWLGFYDVLIWTFGEILKNLTAILFWAMILELILNWLKTPHQNFHDILILLTALTTPLLNPLRRFIPPIANIDLTPIIALILIKIAEILLVSPLIQIGVNALGTD